MQHQWNYWAPGTIKDGSTAYIIVIFIKDKESTYPKQLGKDKSG